MRRLPLLTFLVCAAMIARAQTNSYSFSTAPSLGGVTNLTVMSLEDCVQMALAHNLDLKIDRYNPQLAYYTLRIDYSGWDPTLSLSAQHQHDEQGVQLFGSSIPVGASIVNGEVFNNNGSVLSGTLPWGTQYGFTASMASASRKSPGETNIDNASGLAQLQLTQPLLKNFLIDQTRFSIQVDKNRLKYSEQLLRLNLMATVTSVEQAYYDLIYNQENVAVQEESVRLAETLASENRQKVSVGALALLDEQQAESQAATARAQLIAARSTLALAEHTMKQLLAEDYSAWADKGIQPSGKLSDLPQSYDRMDSWTKGLTMRPEILQAKLDLEKAGIQLKYDKNQFLPEVDLTGSYGFNGSGETIGDSLNDIQGLNHATYSIGGKLTMPLANIKARNAVKSDKLTVQQALVTVKKWERDIMKAIDDDIQTARSDYEQVLATRAAREYAQLALDAEQKKLDNGKSTTFLVLQAQSTLTTARGSEIQALDNYNKELSQLSVDEGFTLDRLGIRVEVH